MFTKMLYLVLLSLIASIHSFPLESYKNYLFVQVHGVANNASSPGGFDYPRPSLIFDGRDQFLPFDNGNVNKVLGDLVTDTRVYRYDMAEPAETPYEVDDNGNVKSDIVCLARELGPPLLRSCPLLQSN